MVTIEALQAKKEALTAKLDPHFRQSEQQSYVQQQQRILDQITQLTLWIADYPAFLIKKQIEEQTPKVHLTIANIRPAQLSNVMKLIRAHHGQLTDVQAGLTISISFTNPNNLQQFKETLACL